MIIPICLRSVLTFFLCLLPYIPTAFALLGKSHYDTSRCLDAQWVAKMALRYNLSNTYEDGRKVYPTIREALPKPRYIMNDARFNTDKLYSKCQPGVTYYGKDAIINLTTGAIVDYGNPNGSFVIEVNLWDTHEVMSMVSTIILEEILGYEVTHYVSYGSATTTARMSNGVEGKCSPVHANMEVWPAGKEVQIQLFSNETFNVGGSGYTGRSGWYTTKNFSLQAEGLATNPEYTFSKTLYTDFWKDYRYEDELISKFPIGDVQASGHFSQTPSICASSDGCLNNCAKSKACTEYEALNKTCLTVILIHPEYDAGYLQSAVANNGIPSYFCYLGMEGAVAYIDEATANGKPVTFYHWQPDRYHEIHSGEFYRISLPNPVPEIVNQANGLFGDLGYGEDTSNPNTVDFPVQLISKYATSAVQSHPPLLSTLSQISLTQLQIENLLTSLMNLNRASPAPNNPFKAACDWIQENYETWKTWIPKLPLCSNTHFNYTISGCHQSVRTIEFAWNVPDPDNSSVPYECDGGSKLPTTLITSRSCDWLESNHDVWMRWATVKPTCDENFYSFNVSGCDDDYRTITYYWNYPNFTNSLLSNECQGGLRLPEPFLTYHQCSDILGYKSQWLLASTSSSNQLCSSRFYNYSVAECDDSSNRVVTWYWLYANPINNSLPGECKNGESLPSPETISCDYTPYNSSTFKAILSFGVIVLTYVSVITILTFLQRDHPVIKRSQWQMLFVMCLGGLVMITGTILYAGKPTSSLCIARPFVFSSGFIMIFGALVIKSYRVYRIFENKGLKKVIFPISLMLKYFALILIVDIAINSIWVIVSTPKPTVEIENIAGVGLVDFHVCSSSSSAIYQVLGFFWKGILLLTGCYFSFKIRNVASDFQETSWMFLSVSVVALGCLVLFPLEYLVDLSAAVSYVFLSAGVTLLTFLVISLMMMPKFLKMRTISIFNTNSTANTIRVSAGTVSADSPRDCTTANEARAAESEIVRLLSEENQALKKKLEEKESLLLKYESKEE